MSLLERKSQVDSNIVQGVGAVYNFIVPAG